MTKEELRAETEENLNSILCCLDELGVDPDKMEDFEKLGLLLSLYPDTCALGAILAAALIRLKKLEARVQDSKDMSIERDLSE